MDSDTVDFPGCNGIRQDNLVDVSLFEGQHRIHQHHVDSGRFRCGEFTQTDVHWVSIAGSLCPHYVGTQTNLLALPFIGDFPVHLHGLVVTVRQVGTKHEFRPFAWFQRPVVIFTAIVFTYHYERTVVFSPGPRPVTPLVAFALPPEYLLR